MLIFIGIVPDQTPTEELDEVLQTLSVDKILIEMVPDDVESKLLAVAKEFLFVREWATQRGVKKEYFDWATDVFVSDVLSSDIALVQQATSEALSGTHWKDLNRPGVYDECLKNIFFEIVDRPAFAEKQRMMVQMIHRLSQPKHLKTAVITDVKHLAFFEQAFPDAAFPFRKQQRIFPGEKKMLYKTPYSSLKSRPCLNQYGKNLGDWYFVGRHDVAQIFAITKKNELVLIKKFWPTISEYSFNLPGGLCDKDGEDPLETAQRELVEETGYGGGRWQLLFKKPYAPAISENYSSVYLAEGVERIKDPEQHPLEDIEVFPVSMVPGQNLVCFLREQYKNGITFDPVILALHVIVHGWVE